MKNIISFIILLSLYSCALSENERIRNGENWTLIWNKDSTLFGYEDKNGDVKIEPNILAWGCNRSVIFENIVPVIDTSVGVFSYYLTKSGNIVGKDSVYFFDSCFDCESEGFIRFRNRETEKVGLFNRNGDVAIPAEYDILSEVNNGVLSALKGAKRENWGEHYMYKGGEVFLIDTLNNILVENFSRNIGISLHSLEKTKIPTVDSTKISFLGVNGEYYTFTYSQKEFEQWFIGSFLENITVENILESTYYTLEWNYVKYAKEKIVIEKFDQLESELSEILTPNYKYFSTHESLDKFNFQYKEFEKYKNNCNEHKSELYPMFSIVKDSYSLISGKELLTFLRTENGYKLISVRFFD